MMMMMMMMVLHFLAQVHSTAARRGYLQDPSRRCHQTFVLQEIESKWYQIQAERVFMINKGLNMDKIERKNGMKQNRKMYNINWDEMTNRIIKPVVFSFSKIEGIFVTSNVYIKRLEGNDVMKWWTKRERISIIANDEWYDTIRMINFFLPSVIHYFTSFTSSFKLHVHIDRYEHVIKLRIFVELIIRSFIRYNRLANILKYVLTHVLVC